MVKLKCPNKKCLYEWDFNGNAPFYACCPRCRYQVNIQMSGVELMKADKRYVKDVIEVKK